MNVLSLFSGIGGLELGLERAGMTVVGQVEINEYCRRVLAKHWPEVPRHDDVHTTVEWWRSEPRPAVHVVCGGFPCQPVSLAGKGLAQADERWLWPAMWAVIRDLRPDVAIMENVPGLLGRGIGDVLGDLAAGGYDAEWDCVPAAAVGAPHRRDRVFIVAYPARGGAATAQQSRLVRGVEPSRQTLADAASDGRRQGWAGRPASDRENRALVTTPRLADAARTGSPNRHGVAHRRPEATRRIFAERPRRNDREQWATEPDVGRVASRLSSGMDGRIDAHTECIEKGRAAGIPATVRLRALRDYIAATEAPSRPERCALCGHPLPAMPCRGACSPWYLGHRIEEAEDLRCVREGLRGLLAHEGQELFRGLPVGSGTTQRTQTMGSRVDRLRALGNAVVPQVAEHIGRLVMAGAS